jgi:hypothetical protein
LLAFGQILLELRVAVFAKIVQWVNGPALTGAIHHAQIVKQGSSTQNREDRRTALFARKVNTKTKKERIHANIAMREKTTCSLHRRVLLLALTAQLVHSMMFPVLVTIVVHVQPMQY